MRWPLCAKRRPDPSGLGHLSRGKVVNLQGYKHRRHAQTQSQPSACGCAKGTSVGTQCKKSCGNIAPNQPSSLSSSERALRNPGKTELPRFHLTRIFFSFPFFFPKKKTQLGLTGVKGEKGNPGIGTQGPRGPPGPAGTSSYPTANCSMETPSLHFPSTLQARQMTIFTSMWPAGAATFPYYIFVANWSGHVSILHPRGRLERPRFHITSVWPTGAAMFPMPFTGRPVCS